jgi:hypothetical protein
VDQHDHPLDHLLPEESSVPIVVNDMYLQLHYTYQTFNIYQIQRYDQKSNQNKSDRNCVETMYLIVNIYS